MQMKSFEQKIFDYLCANLSPKRFEHSYYTAKFAVELARIYGVDVLKAQTAGLLHDCAKGMPQKRLISFCRKNCGKIKKLEEIIKYAPDVLHSFAAAVIAQKRFKIKDNDILNAINNHTIGRENMSALEKIIFVSDAVSYDRKFRFASKIRKLAKADFDAAFKTVMRNKIEYVLSKGLKLCPQALETWNYYAV
jgi:predicted HD superfamily hydrolase involved in NAD metabolism